jgi:glyoxylase-like metal-dependent hydrolase (beta-lactamase superfamily II)
MNRGTMHRSFAAAFASLLWSVAASAAPPRPLRDAAAMLGVGNLRSLQFSAVGTRYQGGQSLWTEYPYMPGRAINSYQASFDFDATRLRVESDMVTSPSTGYFLGNQHSVEMLSDGFVWSVAQEPVGRPVDPAKAAAQPQPGALFDRLFWLWSATPQGVLKAAENSAVRSVPGGTEASYVIAGHRVTAFINQLDQVTRVETLEPNPVLGDTRRVVRYSGYRDFGGIQFPSLISVYEGDYPEFALAVTSVQTNPTMATIQVPDNVRNYALPQRTVQLQNIADGVYWVLGSSHNSMLVDMGNSLVMVEAPLDEARSTGVIAATKQLMPRKPIRYVINTHVHFDHSGGLRTYVDAGAVVVTQTVNRAFYEKAWAAPRTLDPDRLSKSHKQPTFITVDESTVIRGTNGRTIEILHLQGSPHNEQNMVAWLPAERILFESDMLNGVSYSAPEAHPTPVLTNFYENLQRLKIRPVQIVGGHGSHITTMADLKFAVGGPPAASRPATP